MLDSSALLQTLLDHEVRFVLVGGLAMISHGSAHVTKDMDICYDRSPENIQLLVTALKPFHPSLRGVPAGLPFVQDEPTIQAGLNFTLVTDAGELDLLGEITGLGTYETVKQWSQPKTLYGREMPVLSLDGLIRSKQASHRTRDQLHLLELEALKKLLSEIS